MRRLSYLCTVSLFLSTLFVSFESLAQAPPQDPYTAARVEQLYNDAVREMDAGNYGSACPKLAEAVGLAPDKAIGARLTLGDCYKKWGKLASARSEYLQAAAAAAKAGQKDRQKDAEEKAADLRKQVAELKINLPAAQLTLRGFALSLDGKVVDASRWGEAIPVDPGKHAVVASATGYEPRTVDVEIARNGMQATVVLPELEAVKGAPAGAATSAPPSIVEPAPRSMVPGFVAGGVGVAAAIVGAALVGASVSQGSDIHDNVPRLPNGDPKCHREPVAGEDPLCADYRSKASSASTLGNAGVGLLIGGGVIAAGAVIYLLLPLGKASTGSSRVVPVVGQNGGGLVLTGSF